MSENESKQVETNVLVYMEYITGITKQPKVIKEYTDFKTALDVAEFLSEIAVMKKWTRHSSCESLIRHCNVYSDLYNEGAIMLNVGGFKTKENEK